MSGRLQKRREVFKAYCVTCPTCCRLTGVEMKDVPPSTLRGERPFAVACSNERCALQLAVVLQPLQPSGTAGGRVAGAPSSSSSSSSSLSSSEGLAAGGPPVVALVERVACMIIGYWHGEVLERFGCQLTAPSLPGGVYGGWTYLGEYTNDERDGFGEISFAFTQADRRWVMEEGGRVVGFWGGEMLQGPAWKVHPKDSRHYRGRGQPRAIGGSGGSGSGAGGSVGDAAAAPAADAVESWRGLNCSLVWFKRKRNSNLFFDSEYMGEMEEELLLEPSALLSSDGDYHLASATAGTTTTAGVATGIAAGAAALPAAATAAAAAAARVDPLAAQALSKVHADVARACEEMHQLSVPGPQALEGVETRFRALARRLSEAMVHALCVPGVAERHAPLCKKFVQFVQGGGILRRDNGSGGGGGGGGGPGSGVDGAGGKGAGWWVDYFRSERPRVDELASKVGVLQTKTYAVTSESRTRGRITRKITTM